MKNILRRFDNYLMELINNRIKNDFLDRFMYRITDLGGAIFATFFAIILVIFGNNFISMIGLEALVVMGLGQIVVQSLKKILGRERPYKIIEQLNTFGINLKDYSFPSGHTTASFTIATVLSLNIPVVSLFVFLLATIVGMSRIYLGVHYPTDVVAGIVLGVGSSILVHIYLLDYIQEFVKLMGIV